MWGTMGPLFAPPLHKAPERATTQVSAAPGSPNPIRPTNRTAAAVRPCTDERERRSRRSFARTQLLDGHVTQERHSLKVRLDAICAGPMVVERVLHGEAEFATATLAGCTAFPDRPE